MHKIINAQERLIPHDAIETSPPQKGDQQNILTWINNNPADEFSETI